ncbi:MAG: DNA primase [Lachnospiraceae bacterium]|nr:DNA primase [Lachnospiraceae bacterium]
MPLYSEELIEEVRSRSDIVAVIGARIKLTRKGANYFACCPFHNENTPSFSVSPNKQMYYCFGCGAGGNVITFLMNYDNVSFQDAMTELAGRAGITLPEREMSEDEKKQERTRQRYFSLNGEAAKYYYYQLRDPAGKAGLDYFTRRGLSEETLRRFGLGYAGANADGLVRYLRKKGYGDEELKALSLARFYEDGGAKDFFRERVMFPIMDRSNRVIGFGGRILSGARRADGRELPKYLNSTETPVFDKSRNLYGLNLARASRRPYFLLCEGYMDVIALHQAGFDCAVATLGTALTGGHAQLFRRLGKPVILCYDSDAAGVNAAMRGIPILRSAGIECRRLDMRPYKDPDEYIVHEGAEAFEKRIEGAQNAFLFQSDVWRSQYKLEDPAGRTAFQRKLAEELTVFTEALERENYIEAVCKRHKIPEEHLKGLVNAVGNRRYTEEITEPDPETLMQGAAPRGTKGPAGLLAAAQMLLAWAALSPAEPERIRTLLREEDMPEVQEENVPAGIYRTLYRVILEEKEKKKTLQPAALVSRFVEDEAASKLAATVFTRTLSEDLSFAERSRILSENLQRLRKESLRNALREGGDPSRAGKLVKEMAAIGKLEIKESEI